MKAEDIYKKETGLNPYVCGMVTSCSPTYEYLMWLEKVVEDRYEPDILKWIKTMFEHAEKKQWFETYFAIDLHGTVIESDYRRNTKELIFFPYAKETLQLLTKREDIILIMYTSSYPHEIEYYKKELEKNDIIFNYINENPEVSTAKGSFGYYDNKFYFNALFDDKSSFSGKDWKFLYEYFSTTPYRPQRNWSMKYKEDYHK